MKLILQCANKYLHYLFDQKLCCIPTPASVHDYKMACLSAEVLCSVNLLLQSINQSTMYLYQAKAVKADRIMNNDINALNCTTTQKTRNIDVYQPKFAKT